MSRDRCAICGYELTGCQGERCPECGVPRVSGRRIRRGLPPSVWHCSAIVALTLAVIYEKGIVPSFRITYAIVWFGFPLGVIVFADYGWRLIARRVWDAEWRAWGSGSRPYMLWSRWVYFPACAFVCYAATSTAWPMRIRFDLSRDAFERAASACLASPSGVGAPGRIGSYRVNRIERGLAGSVRFDLGGDGFQRVGFVRRRPPERDEGAILVIDFGDGWYLSWWD